MTNAVAIFPADVPSTWRRAVQCGSLRAALDCAFAQVPRARTENDTDDSAHDADHHAIAACLAGDGDAFAQLIERYQRAIAEQMGRFSRDPAVLEELVHDVFVEAYFSLRSFRRKSPLLHWLRKIAVRVGYRHWKRQAQERKHAIRRVDSPEVFEQLASGPSREQTEAGALVSELLDLLSPRDRLVLTLLYWDAYTVAETAELIGWSRSMVKVQAHRARKRLRRRIEESMR